MATKKKLALPYVSVRGVYTVDEGVVKITSIKTHVVNRLAFGSLSPEYMEVGVSELRQGCDTICCAIDEHDLRVHATFLRVETIATPVATFAPTQGDLELSTSHPHFEACRQAILALGNHLR